MEWLAVPLALLTTGIFILLAMGLYFAPTIGAVLFKHRNVAAIGILNLFLGWTLLGWVAALVWAFTDNRKSPPTAPYDPSGEAPRGIGDRVP